MAREAELLSAALAGRYAIGAEIGSGGMARVYEADDLRHDRKVAIKVLASEVADALGPDRFLKEIRIAANLSHPHILPLYDSGQAEGFLYYVMPLVTDETLRDRLDREDQLPIEEVLRITHEVASALQHAHDQGIVHRDVKPENVLLYGNSAVLADFGIAKAVSEAAGATRLTATGLAIGTVAYMSPEQGSGESKLDHRSDQYSLACVVYEMLVGDPPYVGSSPHNVLARKLTEQPSGITVVRDTVPSAMEEVVQKGLARLPADRYGSVMAFAEALRAAARAPRLMATRRSKRATGRRAGRKSATLALAVAGGIAALALGGWLAAGQLGGGGSRGAIRSMALLPIDFAIDTAEYGALLRWEGAIREQLALATGLEMPPEEDVQPYADSELPLAQIGRELDVDAVARVSFFPSTNRQIRVLTEAVRVEDGSPILNRDDTIQYDDILVLTERIVLGFLDRLVATDPTLSFHRPDRAAYNEYLLALDAVGPDEGAGVVEHFERAVAIDPEFARAWAALAETLVYSGLWFRDTIIAADAMQRAQQAVERALALDSLDASSHCTRSSIQYHHGWDFEAALTSAEKAIALGGSCGLFMKATALNALGRYDEAMAFAEDHLARYPAVNMYYLTAVGAGYVDEARRAFEAAKASGYPDLVMPFMEALELIREGRYAEAGDSIVAFRFPLIGAVSHAKAGNMERAFAIIDSTAARVQVEPALVAAVYAVAGDTAKVVEWLERALRERDYALIMTGIYKSQPPNEHHGLYRDLWAMRDHPSIRRIVQRMGLPDID